MKGVMKGFAIAIPCLLIALWALVFAPGVSTAVDASAEPSGVLIVTRFGNITIELFLDECPLTAGNFKNLTREGFYNGLTFHRVVNYTDFKIIQGGDPNGDGTGGPGYTIDFEESAGFNPHMRGSVAMARGAGMNTAGSQFYICGNRINHLDGEFAVFGRVASGMDVVDAILATPTRSDDSPVTPVVMTNVTLWDVLPPTADAGKDFDGYIGNRIELDGSRSSDDIGVTGYTWTFVHRGKTVTLDGKNPDYRFKEAGEYNVTLTVEDAAGNSASDTFILTIKEKDLARHLFEWSTIIFLLAAILVLSAIAAAGRRKKGTDAKK